MVRVCGQSQLRDTVSCTNKETASCKTLTRTRLLVDIVERQRDDDVYE
jgi:hypothetical protein